MSELKIMDQAIEKLSLPKDGPNNEFHRHVHMVSERMARTTKIRRINRALKELAAAVGTESADFDIADANRISVSVAR